MPRALQPGVSRIRMGQPSQLADGGVAVRPFNCEAMVEVYLTRLSVDDLETKVNVKMQ